LEAYEFLHHGLARAVKKTHGEKALDPSDEGEPSQRHVTGKQMCQGLCDEAVHRWGMLAQTVLARWNIHETLDFGNMVYLLIRHGFMKKTDEDSLEDFRDVFDFDQALSQADNFELTE
jgi:uncharacterized repeat protein (TIGR04138 family)